MTYHVYRHWTLEPNPRCFNVGKGLGNRPYSNRSRNHKWHAIVKRYGLRVEVCSSFDDNDLACQAEIALINEMKTFSECHDHDNPDDIGCNFTRGGEGAPGYHHTDETRSCLSQKSIGNKNCLGRDVSEDTRKKISGSKIGVKNPALSQILRGRPLSDEHRQHISESLSVSQKFKETHARRSDALKGREPYNKGKILPDEHRSKISKGLLGNTNTKGKKRGPTKCSICGVRGHKRSTCKKRDVQ